MKNKNLVLIIKKEGVELVCPSKKELLIQISGELDNYDTLESLDGFDMKIYSKYMTTKELLKLPEFEGF